MRKFNYWTRKMVIDRLRLSIWQSYRFLPPTPSGRIRSDHVFALLNKARVGIPETVTVIPHDLMTPEELVAHFTAENITHREILRWSRRVRCVPPHFRLSKRLLLFSASALERWLSEQSLPHDRRRTA